MDIKDKTFNSLKGFFLIAMPEMADSFFGRSVVCICEHSPEGALGLVINHPHALIKASQIFDEFDIQYNGSPDAPLLIGGPVQLEEVFVLHRAPFIGQNILEVTPELALSTTFDTLEALGNDQKNAQFLVTLGCSGWGAGQLEAELRENAWLTIPADLNVIFNVAVEDKWDAAIRSAGIDPVLLNSTAGNA